MRHTHPCPLSCGAAAHTQACCPQPLAPLPPGPAQDPPLATWGQARPGRGRAPRAPSAGARVSLPRRHLEKADPGSLRERAGCWPPPRPRTGISTGPGNTGRALSPRGLALAAGQAWLPPVTPAFVGSMHLGGTPCSRVSVAGSPRSSSWRRLGLRTRSELCCPNLVKRMSSGHQRTLALPPGTRPARTLGEGRGATARASWESGPAKD